VISRVGKIYGENSVKNHFNQALTANVRSEMLLTVMEKLNIETHTHNPRH
jgi:hypothetical protein